MNIFRIVKKELDKIFKFPRQIITAFILPGLLLFLIYAFIGVGLSSVMEEGEEQASIIYVINSPESLESIYSIASSLKVDLRKEDVSELNNLKQAVLNEEIAAVLVYDEDFDNNIQKSPLPKVSVFYVSTASNAYAVMERAQTIIGLQQKYIYEDLDIDPNLFNVGFEKLESDQESVGSILAMILPMMVMSFIFASALGVGSDAIAGEKERGTLATLLMLPIKRSNIIIGKIISTSTITVLSALSSFIGLLAAMPFAKAMFALGDNATISYSAMDIIGLIVILLLIALLASSILLIFSTLAKNIKEASTMALPVYIAAIISPLLTMFTTGGSSSKIVYLIPVYNTILGLKDILSFNFDIINFLIILGSSVLYISIIVFVLVRMFKSEKVLYSK
ncbi:MAG: ABC transporter permease [Bacilli bacterium]|nr:ABC transporter permease [Bacilli bacterium]